MSLPKFMPFAGATQAEGIETTRRSGPAQGVARHSFQDHASIGPLYEDRDSGAFPIPVRVEFQAMDECPAATRADRET
jgi:hypothetical protein